MIQRDFGDRTERKHARLKYTIDDRGIDWFKGELTRRLGFELRRRARSSSPRRAIASAGCAVTMAAGT
jgi:sulfite reductase beta subunit-like hemoprotein